jgi:hypothetical protein
VGAKDGFDKVTIDTSGNVNVNGGGYVKIAPADTQADLRLYRDDATINAAGIAIGDINFGGADADNDNAARLRVKSDGAWTSTSSPTAFEFQTCPSGSESPQTRLVIDSTGLATFSGGISFQSATTGSGTGVGYTLENYEFGTFTMGLIGTTATIPSGHELARYYRIGNLVWISWWSGAMTLAGSSGAARLTGLPFTVRNNVANYSVFSYTYGNAVDGNSRGGYFAKSTTQMWFVDDGAVTNASFVNGSNQQVIVTGVYETSDA